MFLKQGDKLLFKPPLFVMRLLISDVLNDGWDIGTAHAERAITLLPRESVAFPVCPSRRIRFDGENPFGHGQTGRNLDEEMNVVLSAAYGMNEDLDFLANACHLSPEARLKFWGDGLVAIFGAEDDMEHILGVCVGHVPHLRR
jgi:hypothetical protein